MTNTGGAGDNPTSGACGCGGEARDEFDAELRETPLELVGLVRVVTEDSRELSSQDLAYDRIAENLRSALEQIESVLGDLRQRAALVDREP